jgi:uncharacterized Zn finger protein
MIADVERCPDCGGGPVKPVSWRHTRRSGMEAVQRRCGNCGTVETVPKSERRY